MGARRHRRREDALEQLLQATLALLKSGGSIDVTQGADRQRIDQLHHKVRHSVLEAFTQAACRRTSGREMDGASHRWWLSETGARCAGITEGRAEVHGVHGEVSLISKVL
jgi:hypothetical protein